MSEPLPYFAFYASDFIGSGDVAAMTLAERGAYITLLARQWMDGSIPADPERIARLLAEPSDTSALLWSHIARLFVPHPDLPDRLVNIRLEKERVRANEKYEKRRQNGALGGKRKAENAKKRASDTSSVTTPTTTEKGGQKPSNTRVELRDKIESIVANAPILSGGAEFSESIPSSLPSPQPDLTPTVGAREQEGPSQQSSLPLLSGEPAAVPPKAKPPRAGPSEADLAAYAVLDATWAVVMEHVPDVMMSAREWRMKNKAAALRIVEQGWPVERIIELMKFAYTNPEATPYYGSTYMLAKFLEAAPRLRQIRDGKTAKASNDAWVHPRDQPGTHRGMRVAW